MAPRPDTNIFSNEMVGEGTMTIYDRYGAVQWTEEKSIAWYDRPWGEHHVRMNYTSNPLYKKTLYTGVSFMWRDTSAHVRVKRKRNFSKGTITWADDKGWKPASYTGTQVDGNGFGVLSPFLAADETPVGPGQNTLNRLNTELMLKVGDRKVSYGETFGEMHKTANHLASSAKQAFRAYKQMRRGNIGGMLRELGVTTKRPTTRDPAKGWLQYNYAWMPLFNDIYDTYKLLDTGFREKALVASAVRRLSESHTYGTGGKPEHPAHRETSGNSEAKYEAKVYFNVNPSTFSNIGALGLLNPLEVAWAVMPYSFVIDWILPVGNVLEAMTSHFGTTFIDGYYTTKVKDNYTFTWNPGWAFNESSVVSNTVTSNQYTESFRRSRMTSFPFPMPYVKSPFSTKHLLSAAALFRQLIR